MKQPCSPSSGCLPCDWISKALPPTFLIWPAVALTPNRFIYPNICLLSPKYFKMAMSAQLAPLLSACWRNGFINAMAVKLCVCVNTSVHVCWALTRLQPEMVWLQATSYLGFAKIRQRNLPFVFEARMDAELLAVCKLMRFLWKITATFELMIYH